MGFEKIEKSAIRFDKKGKGKLSADDLYSVVKLQNKMDVSKAEIKDLIAQLNKDEKDSKFVSIADFFHTPIVSEEVFLSMDKNKDGFITKGELRLAQKSLKMTELSKIMSDIDKNSDGKLTLEEVRAIAKKASDTSKKK